jgi:hypothetical protein
VGGGGTGAAAVFVGVGGGVAGLDAVSAGRGEADGGVSGVAATADGGGTVGVDIGSVADVDGAEELGVSAGAGGAVVGDGAGGAVVGDGAGGAVVGDGAGGAVVADGAGDTGMADGGAAWLGGSAAGTCVETAGGGDRSTVTRLGGLASGAPWKIIGAMTMPAISAARQEAPISSHWRQPDEPAAAGGGGIRMMGGVASVSVAAGPLAAR